MYRLTDMASLEALFTGMAARNIVMPGEISHGGLIFVLGYSMKFFLLSK